MRLTLPIRLYPIALALASVGELFIVSAASPFSAIRAFTIAVAVAVALSIIGRILLGDRDRAGLFAALGILTIMAGRDPRVLLALGVAVVLLFVERYAVPTTRRTIDWPRISRIVGSLTGVLLLAMVIQAIQLGTPGLIARAVTHQTPLRPAVTATASPTDPDIYMILLDGHARADVLDEVFDAEGSTFDEALEDRGFSVVPRSRSDYEVTVETLTSMFNMALLPDIDRLDTMYAGRDGRPPGGVFFDAINDSAVLADLRARGYEIEAIGSGFEEVSMREADTFVDTGELNEFEIGMLRRTIAGDVLTAVAPDFASAQQRSRISNVLDETVDLAADASGRPRFVFAHVPSPHAPWVTHADGSPRTVEDLGSFYRETPETTGLSEAELIAGYAGQVQDIDRRLLAMLERLEPVIDARARPSVVIVFSDHGSWVGAEGPDRERRVHNLLAVRSTEQGITLAPDLTLVHLFPTLFAQLFGPDWPQTGTRGTATP